jgi:hypothetical protein
MFLAYDVIIRVTELTISQVRVTYIVVLKLEASSLNRKWTAHGAESRQI